MNVVPQVGRHVRRQVAEAVQRSQGQVKRKPADQGKDSIEFAEWTSFWHFYSIVLIGKLLVFIKQI
jgi:hypothetical protein